MLVSGRVYNYIRLRCLNPSLKKTRNFTKYLPTCPKILQSPPHAFSLIRVRFRKGLYRDFPFEVGVFVHLIHLDCSPLFINVRMFNVFHLFFGGGSVGFSIGHDSDLIQKQLLQGGPLAVISI